MESKYIIIKDIPFETPGAFLCHNEDESEAVQIEMFKLGYKWNRRETVVHKFSETSNSELPYWIFWDNEKHHPNLYDDVPGMDYSAPELFRSGTDMLFATSNTYKYKIKDYFKLKEEYRGHNMKKFGI